MSGDAAATPREDDGLLAPPTSSLQTRGEPDSIGTQSDIAPSTGGTVRRQGTVPRSETIAIATLALSPLDAAGVNVPIEERASDGARPARAEAYLDKGTDNTALRARITERPAWRRRGRNGKEGRASDPASTRRDGGQPQGMAGSIGSNTSIGSTELPKSVDETARLGCGKGRGTPLAHTPVKKKARQARQSE